MKIIGCDLHARQQTIAMLDTDTGEVVEQTLEHEGEKVREFYSALLDPVRVGIEASGSMQWFLQLMEELGIDCQVGHPAKIRAAEPRKQKHDRRDAALLLKLLIDNRFPSIWMPSTEQRDLRTLLRHRHQWVRMRTRVQDTLQAMALNNGLRRGTSLWSQAGQHALKALPLAPHASQRRAALMTLYPPMHAVRRDPELKRFYRRKLVQKGLGKARAAAARKLGIRLWIMLRDQIDYQEFCRRGQMRRESGCAHAGMPGFNSGPGAQ